MIIDRNFWHNRRVLVTGHAGFKGSWLCEWLMQVGADVIGYGRHNDRKPSIFHALELEHRIYPCVVGWLAAGRLELDAADRPVLDGKILARPLLLGSDGRCPNPPD